MSALQQAEDARGVTFSEALADQVHDLERRLLRTQWRLASMKRSRDLWRHRALRGAKR